MRGSASSSGAMVWQGSDRNSNNVDTADKRSRGIPAALRDDKPSIQTQSVNSAVLPINVDLLLVSWHLCYIGQFGTTYGVTWACGCRLSSKLGIKSGI